jgi:hypothetical protein
VTYVAILGPHTHRTHQRDSRESRSGYTAYCYRAVSGDDVCRRVSGWFPGQRERLQEEGVKLEKREIPAGIDWKLVGLGALLGVTGAGLLYGVGAAVAWVVRGFKR